MYMGRKKIPNPKQAKTISLPKHLWEAIDLQNKNRSYYIERCIKVHMNDVLLDESEHISNIETKQLVAILFNRMADWHTLDPLDEQVRDLLLRYLREGVF